MKHLATQYLYEYAEMQFTSVFKKLNVASWEF